eukprot:gene23279-30512_t
MSAVTSKLWGVSTALISMVDWPIRRLTGGWGLSSTYPVRSSTASYDKRIAADLWKESALIAKLPETPAV